jgi:hypothetical protein
MPPVSSHSIPDDFHARVMGRDCPICGSVHFSGTSGCAALFPEARGYNVARTLAIALTCPRHGLNYVDACPSCLEETCAPGCGGTESEPPAPDTRSLKAPPNPPVDQLGNSIAWLELD